MIDKLHCPDCALSHIKPNGHTYYGAQNYQGLACDRQFVQKTDTISVSQQALIAKLLLERVSWRGITRVAGVALTTLWRFTVGL